MGRAEEDQLKFSAYEQREGEWNQEIMETLRSSVPGMAWCLSMVKTGWRKEKVAVLKPNPSGS